MTTATVIIANKEYSWKGQRVVALKIDGDKVHVRLSDASSQRVPTNELVPWTDIAVSLELQCGVDECQETFKNANLLGTHKRIRHDIPGASPAAKGRATIKLAQQSIPTNNHGIDSNVTTMPFTADFTGVKNTELPYSVRNAIMLTLNTAGHQAILGEGSGKAYFEGFLSGVNIGLGIICGAAGIDLSFLKEDEGAEIKNDTSTDNT